MNLSQLSIICISLLFATSCLNSPEEPEVYSDINGVVSEGGSPVSGADIHIKSHYEPGGFIAGQQTDVDIEFTVTTAGLFVVDLYRLGSTNRFAVIFEDTLDLGEQVITVPDSLLTNGVYVYQITTPLDQVAQSNFLINKPDSALIYTEPLTRTNAQGEFDINADYLAIGTTFRRGENESFEITDSLQILVIRDEAIVARESIKVNTEEEDENFVEISID